MRGCVTRGNVKRPWTPSRGSTYRSLSADGDSAGSRVRRVDRQARARRPRILLWALAHPRARATPGHGVCGARVSPARRRAHRAPPGDRRASGDLPARSGGGGRRGGPTAVRGTRVPGLPAVRGVRGRRGTVSVRGLRARAPGPVLVQRAGVVSELWGSADDGAGRPSGGRGAAVGAGATVGADGAVPAALPDGVRPWPEPGGARRVRAGAVRRLCARRPRARRRARLRDHRALHGAGAARGKLHAPRGVGRRGPGACARILTRASHSFTLRPPSEPIVTRSLLAWIGEGA